MKIEKKIKRLAWILPSLFIIAAVMLLLDFLGVPIIESQ